MDIESESATSIPYLLPVMYVGLSIMLIELPLIHFYLVPYQNLLDYKKKYLKKVSSIKRFVNVSINKITTAD